MEDEGIVLDALKCEERRSIKSIIDEVAERLRSGGGSEEAKIDAARDIRKLVRKSSSSAKARSRFAAAGVIPPLVQMLSSSSPSSSLSAREAALLALLNLAVRNDRNKVMIVSSGAIPPLVDLLKCPQDGHLRELATAAVLSLSTAASNKPAIAASGVAPLLTEILSSGSVQGRVDAVTALHNLSTSKEPKLVLDAIAAPHLINLLKECKKNSKFAEKTTALLEILSSSDEGRIAITNVDGGILTLVETVEDGSLVSTENAVGALLLLCQSCRDRYRELILNEGAIPGLLRLTAEGTPEAQQRARALLDLLRNSPPEKRLTCSLLERIVYDFAAQVDGADKAAETAKRLLQDMVHRSMEMSMSRIQLQASSSTPSKMSV